MYEKKKPCIVVRNFNAHTVSLQVARESHAQQSRPRSILYTTWIRRLRSVMREYAIRNLIRRSPRFLSRATALFYRRVRKRDCDNSCCPVSRKEMPAARTAVKYEQLWRIVTVQLPHRVAASALPAAATAPASAAESQTVSPASHASVSNNEHIIPTSCIMCNS